MPKYRKKPVVVEAVRWTGSNLEEIRNFVGSDLIEECVELFDIKRTLKEMLSKEEQLKLETELILLLDELCSDCMLYRGVKEKYVIASTLFRGKFALGRIVDCNHIYKAIEESGKQCLSPREVFKIFVNKEWLDYDE